MTEPIETSEPDASIRASDIAVVKRSPKPKWHVSVSLEFDLQPVLTWRGHVEGASPNGAANAAVKAAKKAFPGKKPRTWALVLEKI